MTPLAREVVNLRFFVVRIVVPRLGKRIFDCLLLKHVELLESSINWVDCKNLALGPWLARPLVDLKSIWEESPSTNSAGNERFFVKLLIVLHVHLHHKLLLGHSARPSFYDLHLLIEILRGFRTLPALFHGQ